MSSYVAPSLVRDGSKRERIELQNALCEVFPKHRSFACLRHRLGDSSSVTVAATNQGTWLGGLMVCGSAHICPVCHYRKMTQEQRINSEIVRAHYQASGILVDAVLTVPHQEHETLEGVLARLETVWKKLRLTKNWRPLSLEIGIVGFLRRSDMSMPKNP